MDAKKLTDYLIKNKGLYRLWYEYLKQNNFYRDYCEGESIVHGSIYLELIMYEPIFVFYICLKIKSVLS